MAAWPGKATTKREIGLDSQARGRRRQGGDEKQGEKVKAQKAKQWM